MGKLAVIAIGGNSLIKDKRQSVDDQYIAVCETVKHIVDVIEEGYEVIVTHGNGPQVGFIMRRSEIAHETDDMHLVPLVNCDADTQGAIGYQIQQALQNEFHKRGMKKKATTVVSQVEVDKNDKAFSNPSKPIGSFYSEDKIDKIKEEHPNWKLINDSGRGYRRVVPSPMPINIIEQDSIELLIEKGVTVIAVGGGGIPVIRDEEDNLIGVNAVIDKDNASSLLAGELNADLFIISTAVPNVCINFGKENEEKLHDVDMDKIKNLRNEGHFAPGSMLPKINACINFLENGGRKAIITCPEELKEAVMGDKGTIISK